MAHLGLVLAGAQIVYDDISVPYSIAFISLHLSHMIRCELYFQGTRYLTRLTLLRGLVNGL